MEKELECCDSSSKKFMLGLEMAIAGSALIALGHFFLCNRKKCK